MIYQMGELTPLSDDDLILHLCIILAAHSEKFPQLRGKAVRPDLRDMAREGFARLLVEKLRQGSIEFYRRKSDHPLMLDSGCFPPHHR